MEIAVLTMVHREKPHLHQWLRHYEPLVGRENLYVLVHGGDPEIIEMLQGCRLIFVPRKVVDWRFNRSRFQLINAYTNFLLTNYDCVISGDVDELVFCDPAISNNLRSFITEHRDRPVLTTLGMHVAHTKDDLPLDPDVPVLRQRRVAMPDSLYSKPLIVFQEPRWTIGFHGSAHDPFLPAGLYMAHIRCADTGISDMIASHRKETQESEENLGNKVRQRYWGKHDLFCLRLRKAVSQQQVQDFDATITNLRENLQSNVEKNVAARGGKSVLFKDIEVPPLLFPERFSNVSHA